MITQYMSNLDMTTLDIELDAEALDSMCFQLVSSNNIMGIVISDCGIKPQRASS